MNTRRRVSILVIAGGTIGALVMAMSIRPDVPQDRPAPQREERRAGGEEDGGQEALSGVTASAEGAAVSQHAVVVHASRHDVSPAFRSLPAAEKTPGTRFVPEYEGVKESTGPAVADPVVQSAATRESTQMPSAATSFAGMGNVHGYTPPDTNGDVGPNHYVQTVNTTMRIYDKSGTPLTATTDTNALWSGFGGLCETTNQGDPIVLYDNLADRWLISQFAFSGNGAAAPFYQCVAISMTPNPTGSYYRYAFLSPSNRFNDYGKLGVWPDGYYMATNEFSEAGSYVGVGAWAMDRTKMLAGQAATMQYFHLGTNYFGYLPADVDGAAAPAGAAEPFVSYDDWSTAGTYKLKMFNYHVDWTTPANSTFTAAPDVTVAAFDSNLCNGASCMPQPGTTNKVDTLADRLMFRLAYRNFGDHQALVVTHTVDVGGDHAGIRWYELRKTTGNWSVFQQGSYAPDAANRWMSSAAMDGNGDIAVGYSRGSSSVYPSLSYAGRLASDPAGQLSQGEASLATGAGSQTGGGGRWGDYASMSIDPVDNCTFWFTSEYYTSTSDHGWTTRIGSFKFPSCGGVATSYTLAVGTSGSGNVTSSPAGINCGATCSAPFTSGQSVQLTAAPASGWTFSGWSGDCSGSTNPCTVTMNAAKNVTATFTASGGKSPSTTTLVLKGGYGTSGQYRLYHQGSRETDTTTVSPAHAGSPIALYVDKWKAATGTWVAVSGSPWTFNLGTGSSVTTYWSPGVGKYRTYASFGGDADHLPSQSAYAYYRFTL
jgi:uncharacterized repeat protein (TIGR02543 family)